MQALWKGPQVPWVESHHLTASPGDTQLLTQQETLCFESSQASRRPANCQFPLKELEKVLIRAGQLHLPKGSLSSTCSLQQEKLPLAATFFGDYKNEWTKSWTLRHHSHCFLRGLKIVSMPQTFPCAYISKIIFIITGERGTCIVSQRMCGV